MRSNEMYEVQVDLVVDTQEPKTLVVEGFKETLKNFYPQPDYFFSATTVAEPLDVETVFEEGKKVGNILKKKMSTKELEKWLSS